MWGVPRLRKNIMSGCTISKFCTKKFLSLHGTVFSIIKIPKWLILVVQISGKLLNSPMQLLQIILFFFSEFWNTYYEWSVCWIVMYFLFKRNLGWGHCLGNWKINVLIAVIIVQKFLNTKLRSFLRSSLNE